MRTTRTALFTLLLAVAPAAALAAAADEKAPESMAKAPKADPAAGAKSTDATKTDATKTEAAKTDAPKTPPASVTAAPDGGRFKIRRGWFALADLGVYATFGGRDVRDIDRGQPKKTISNVEPHLGITVGYDLSHTDTFNFALGLKFAMGLNSGAGRASANDIADSTTNTLTKSNDYSVIETGIEASAAFMTSDRFAITVKVDGGGGFLDPDPGKSADVTGAGGIVFAPVFGVGVGGEYYTLLNDFSVGLMLRFQGILASGGLIPAASITIPIKYTF